MRHPSVLLSLGLTACLSIPQSELDERKAGFSFAVEVLAASPSEAFSCVDVDGLQVTVSIDRTMADVELTPTLVSGEERTKLDAFTVPSNGEVSFTVTVPACTSGVCDDTLTIELETAEGATSSATTQVTRFADPAPRLGRYGLVVDGDLVEGGDADAYLGAGGNTMDPREATLVYAFVTDDLHQAGVEGLGEPRLLACPAGAQAPTEDCVELPAVSLPGGGGTGELVAAAQTDLIGEQQCGSDTAVQLFVTVVGDPCGGSFAQRVGPELRVEADCDGDGSWPSDGDCVDDDPGVVVSDCDKDLDGYVDALYGGDDCDDALDEVHPGATEACDGLDTDCTGGPAADELDVDTDGYVACSDYVERGAGFLGDGDCDDDDDTAYPGAVEVCDASRTDNNCDGYTDDQDASIWGSGFADLDGDGLGDAASPIEGCLDAGLVANDQDCDDGVYWEAPQEPQPMEMWGGPPRPGCPDLDGDLHGDIAFSGKPPAMGCPGPGWAPPDQCDDCDDSPVVGARRFPGNAEVCDGLDNDCLGGVPLDEMDSDSDGFASCTPDLTAPAGFQGGDCDDDESATHPGADDHPCDGVDSDCVVNLLEVDNDGDDYVECDGWVGAYDMAGGDCDDDNDGVNPGAEERCDGIDSDCSGSVADEEDTDGDGYVECDQWEGDGVLAGGDCDDEDNLFMPGAVRRGGDHFGSLQSAIDDSLTNQSTTLEVCGVVDGAAAVGTANPSLSILGRGTQAQILGMADGPALHIESFGQVLLEDILVELVNTRGAQSAPFGRGGALAFDGTDVVLRNVELLDNFALDGGGISVVSGDLLMVNSAVRDNMADRGGGIHVMMGQLVLDNTNVERNVANGDGGGVYVENGDIEMDNGANIRVNNAGFSGGGVYMMLNGDISGNGSIGGNLSGADGGGVFMGGGGRIQDVQITENEADLGSGGGVALSSGDLVLAGTTILDNHAAIFGGGVGVPAATSMLTLTDGEVTGNTAGFDGGGVFLGGSCEVTSVDFSDNDGEGVDAGSDLHLEGAAAQASVDVFSTFTDELNSIVVRDGCATCDTQRYNPNAVFQGVSFTCTGGSCLPD